MDEDLDIRHESLNIQFDELEENAFKLVDQTEERLLSKINKSQPPRSKRARISKKEVNLVNTIKNFPFKSINSMKKVDIGVLRDENKDFKNSIDEDIESSDNSDADSDDWGSYMTDSDDYFEGFHHHHHHHHTLPLFRGLHHHHDAFDEDEDDDSEVDPTDNCSIQ